MRKILVGLVGLALAGCGEAEAPPSAEHVAFTQACTAGGGAAEMCECRASKLDELLAAGTISPDVHRAFVLQEEGKEEEADAIMVTLPPNVLFEQPSAIAEAQQECVAS